MAITAVVKINGLLVREVFPEEEMPKEQWYELAELAALVLRAEE